MLSQRFPFLKVHSLINFHRALLSFSPSHHAAKPTTPAAPAEPAAPTAQSAQLAHNKSKTSLRGTPYNVTDIDTSLRYMESDAYKTVYGNEPVWKNYVRNRTKQRFPHYTRDFCAEEGLYIRGNPCPICRDEYLLLDYRNIKLLKQFVNDHTGEIEPVLKTSICQAQLRNLRVALRKAYDLGLITYEVPFRTYDYRDYYPELRDEKDRTPSLLMTILQTIQDQKLTNLDQLTLSDEQLHAR
jgi:small subunit ribosomal protein S18b